jgi:hypothetical protein
LRFFVDKNAVWAQWAEHAQVFKVLLAHILFAFLLIRPSAAGGSVIEAGPAAGRFSAATHA